MPISEREWAAYWSDARKNPALNSPMLNIFDYNKEPIAGQAQIDLGRYGLAAGSRVDPDSYKEPDPDARRQDESRVDPYWQAILRARAQAAPRANPYQSALAARARPEQVALFNQMRAQQAGPSIASMQGQGAMGQNLQAALQARGPNAGVASRAGAAGAGLGADVARARLAEQMQSSAQQGGVAGGLRARDDQSALNEAKSAMQTRAQDNSNQMAYSSQGANMGRAQSQAELERIKLYQRLLAKRGAETERDAQRSADAIWQAFQTAMGIVGKF